MRRRSGPGSPTPAATGQPMANGPRRHQPDEERPLSLALEGIQGLSRPPLPHRRGGRRAADRVRRPAVILLTNPGLGGRLQVTNTIRCAISIYNPGDIAPAHVHCPNASRTILSDKGGYTNVEGERCEANRGDIILTPNGTWHDHGNEAKEPVIWIDMLDWPLMEFLDCAWVDQEFKPRHRQQPEEPGHDPRPTAIRTRSTATAAWCRPSSRTSAAGATSRRPTSTSAATRSARRSSGCARKPAIRTKASRCSSSTR